MTDLDQLTRLRPDVDEPTPEWLAATRAALVDHAAGTRRSRGWTPRRSNLVAMAAGLAVLAVLALIVPSSSHLPTANQPHDQFVYVKTGYHDRKDDPLTTTEDWHPLDLPANVWHLQGTNGVSISVAAPGTIGWSYQQLKTLPTDPTQLRARLYDMAKSAIAERPRIVPDPPDYTTTPDQEVFVIISQTLVNALAPQDLVAAFHQVLGTIPGVTVDQNASDAAGRPGVGITRVDEGATARRTVVFARDSTLFLGENYVDPAYPAYTPSWVILSSGLVDKVGDRP